MARRVGDDELAQGCRKIAVGHIDGDALLALGLQAVGQQREIDAVAGHALVLSARDGVELVGEDALAVVQQSADQRRLAVVDRTGGDQPQHAVVGAGQERIVQSVHACPQWARQARRCSGAGRLRSSLRVCGVPSTPRRSGRPSGWRRAR
ncbi:Uncharacterised protein [Bordetella pertussis]|nr:Uncharacterised protein [Bordetella pertussis]